MDTECAGVTKFRVHGRKIRSHGKTEMTGTKTQKTEIAQRTVSCHRPETGWGQGGALTVFIPGEVKPELNSGRVADRDSGGFYAKQKHYSKTERREGPHFI